MRVKLFMRIMVGRPLSLSAAIIHNTVYGMESERKYDQWHNLAPLGCAVVNFVISFI